MTEIYKVMHGAINVNKKLYLDPVGSFLKVICVSSPYETESELLFLNIYEGMRNFSKIITVSPCQCF